MIAPSAPAWRLTAIPVVGPATAVIAPLQSKRVQSERVPSERRRQTVHRNLDHRGTAVTDRVAHGGADIVTARQPDRVGTERFGELHEVRVAQLGADLTA